MSDELVPAGQPTILDQSDDDWLCPTCGHYLIVGELCECRCHTPPDYQHPEDDDD